MTSLGRSHDNQVTSLGGSHDSQVTSLGRSHDNQVTSLGKSCVISAREVHTRHTTFSCAVFIDHNDRVLREAGDAGLQGDIEYVPLISGVRCGIKGDRHNCRGTKSPAAVSFTHSLPVISHSDTSDNDMLTFVISDVDSGALKLPGAAPSESHHYEAQHKLFV